MTQNLIIRAGKRAIEHIRANGLRPEDIGVIPGAAGGPKALGIIGLDLAIFGDWLPRAPRTRHLIGASIGAWRFASACRANSVAGLKEFATAYSEQRYPRRPSKQYVSQSARDMMRDLFAGREQELLSSPEYRLHILVVRGLGLLERESRAKTPAAFAAAALANALGRRHLRHFFARTVFHDPRGLPSFFSANSAPITEGPAGAAATFDSFHTQTVALSAANLGQALLASASIPLVLEGVSNIPDALPGTYWDGGIIDYHLHFPYSRSKDLVLYPHFTDKIVAGWLDKALPWRREKGTWLDNVVLVAPSREYLARLPYAKLPDRNDFKRFELAYDARLRYWRAAMSESERLGEEFIDLVETGKIAQRLLPF